MSNRPADERADRRHGVANESASFLFVVVIAVVVYLLFSGGVAISTADKCDGQLHADKSWNLFPPRWECVTTSPGEG